MSKSYNDFIYQDESSHDHDEKFDDFDFISNYSRRTPDRDMQKTEEKSSQHYKTIRHKKCDLIISS